MFKNISILSFILCFSFTALQAQDRLGFSGVFGAYNLSMMPNVDDKNADLRQDFVQTFRYAAGFEKATWYNSNFGIGGQASYWLSGQDYKGADPFFKSTYVASTVLTYGKLGVYLYHKSFNRYKPNARFRFLSYFGPYLGYRVAYTDKLTLKDSLGKVIGETTWVPNGAQNNLSKDTLFLKLKEPRYNAFDFGFTFAPGFQLMLNPKLAIGLNLRADIGGTDVENKGNLRKVIPVTPYEEDYRYWDNPNLYSKFVQSIIPRNEFDKRAETFNSSFGASISIRFYSTPQFEK